MNITISWLKFLFLDLFFSYLIYLPRDITSIKRISVIIKFKFETLRDCPARHSVFSSEYTLAIVHGQLYPVRNNYIKAVYFLWKLRKIREINFVLSSDRVDFCGYSWLLI